MEYLYVSIGIFIIGLVLFIVGLRKEKLTIEEAAEKHKKYIENLTMQQEAEYRQRCVYREALEEDIQRAKDTREVAMERAAEAQAATEQLLQSEQGRLAAEINRQKEIQTIKLETEMKHQRDELQTLYNTKYQDLEQNFLTKKTEMSNEIIQLQSELNDFKARQDSINEAILREKELKEKEDFYRIVIDKDDIRDIEVLRSIESRLVNKEVLNKLIYKTFIEKPLINMEKRVLKSNKIGGIYKITYIQTGESYIGRSVDIGNRWKEHVLSSLSIGTIAHSTFHNELANKGIQNFTWEVLEEVQREKQSDREKYWINFYGTKNQFNEKEGG